MKVSELARLAGTTPKTIRFYEAEGILPAPPRRQNGYRDYDDVDACRARLVVALRGLGIELSEAGRLAELCATGACDAMSGDLVGLVAERRRAIAAAMEELAHLDTELASVQRMLANGEPVPTLCSTRKEDC
ncbi:MAG TPA: MerR family transcriptional regulator [candidate division Zixibacteria bacterium]|nr:MerR family transcriptional regulator [candidate division Zixibacteria bacterium]